MKSGDAVMAASAALNFPRTLTDRLNEITTIGARPSAAGLSPRDEIQKKPGTIILTVSVGNITHRLNMSVPDTPTPPWVAPALERSGYLLALPAGWDGQGAPCIETAFIQRAFDALYTFMADRSAIPQWTPTRGGGVQLDWHENGVDLEMEFGPGVLDGYAVFADLLDRMPEWDGPVVDRIAPLRELFSEVLTR